MAGLALLTKTMSGPFFVAPALFGLVHAWRTTGRGPALLGNAALALATATAVASTWWQTHSTRAIWYLLYFGWGRGADPYAPPGTAEIFTAGSLTYYLRALANEGASVPYVVLMAGFLVRGAWRLRRSREAARPSLTAGLLWAWLLAGYVLLSLSRNKEADRYIIFLVPPVAVLLGGAIARLHAGYRKIVLLAAVLIGLANYVTLTWPRLGPVLLRVRPPFKLGRFDPRQAWLRSETFVPEVGWPLPEIVETLSRSAPATKAGLLPALLANPPAAEATPEAHVRDAYRRLLRREPDPTGLQAYSGELRAGTRDAAALMRELAASREFVERPLRVLVVPDHPFLNASTLRYYAEAARVGISFDRVEPGRLAPPSLLDYDALVVKEGGFQGPPFSTAHVSGLAARLRESGSDLVALPRVLACPDGSLVRLLVAAGPEGS
jgi:hypothetical protein